MFFSKEYDEGFNIQDLYTSAQQTVKRIVVKIGTAMLALYICTGVGYAQEVVSPSTIDNIPAIEMSIQPISPLAYDAATKLVISSPDYYDSSYNYGVLLRSLLSHKGSKMSVDFFSSFESLADQLSVLPFTESLARYSINNNYVNINLVFNKGVELEVTQMPDLEEVAFSVLHDGETMMIATATPGEMTERILRVLNDLK